MPRVRTPADEPAAPPVMPETEAKPNGADADGEELPSAEPGNIVDLASCADEDDDPVRQNIQRVRCSLARPDNFTRFRTWSDKDWWRTYSFLIREGGKGGSSGSSLYYLIVDKSLLQLDELDGRTKRKRLVPYITLAGGLGLWPLGVDDTNAYVASGLYICEQCIREWGCAVSRGREDGEYLYKPPNQQKNYPAPTWPDGLTLNKLLNLAFPRDRQILSVDHPELVRLREAD
jgi:hypothetical protein